MVKVHDLAAGVPIAGFVGINGAGKTLLAVESAISDLRKGREVYSTVPISSEFGDSLPITSLAQILELEDCTVLLDDISVILSSRTTSSLPPEFVAFLQTVRHRKILIRWTAPQWMRADTLVRGVTQALVTVVPVLRVTEADNPWPRPRLVFAALYDTSTGKADGEPEKVLRRRILVPSRLRAFGAYDTHADTPMLAHLAVGGTCPDCAGTRERPRHTKERHEKLGLPWLDDVAPVRESPVFVPVPGPLHASVPVTVETPDLGGGSETLRSDLRHEPE